MFVGDAHFGGPVPTMENHLPYMRLVGATLPPDLSPVHWLQPSGLSGADFGVGDAVMQGDRATQVVASASRTLTFNNASPATITASSGDFTADGYKAGMRLRVRGTTNNDGAYTIAAVSATQITLRDADGLIAEGPLSSSATLDATEGPANRVNATGGQTLTFTSSSKTITRSSGSWLNDGYEVGHRVKVSGTSSNDAAFTVTAVTASDLTVSEAVNDEGPLSSMAYVDGTFGPFGVIIHTLGESTVLYVGILAWKSLLLWENGAWDPAKTLRFTTATERTGTLQGVEKEKGEGGAVDQLLTHGAQQQNWRFNRLTAGLATYWDGRAEWGNAKQVVASGGRTLEFKANNPPSIPATVEASSGDFNTGEAFKHGMRLTVSGTTNNNGTYTIDRVQSTKLTLVSSDTLTDEGPLSSSATLDGDWDSAGMWTEYSPIPLLNGFARAYLPYGTWRPYFKTPPQGSNWKSRVGRGAEVLFMDEMLKDNASDSRLFKWRDVNGSVAVGELNFDAQSSPFTVGATVTGGTSGASATIHAVKDNGDGTGTLYIRSIVKGGGGTDGWFQDDESISDDNGVPGLATANGRVSGWLKGGFQYVDLLTEWNKAISSKKWAEMSSLGLQGGDTVNIKGIALGLSVRDIQLSVIVTTSGTAGSGPTGALDLPLEDGYKQLIADLKSDLEADPVFVLMNPAADYQENVFPFRAPAVRAAVADAVRDVDKVTQFEAGGFEYSSGTGVVGHDQPPTSNLWYEAKAYDLFGKRAYDAYRIKEQGFSPPTGAGVPLYVMLGQSQLVCAGVSTSWLFYELHGDLHKTTNILAFANPSASAVTTVDSRKQIWNDVFEQWEPYNTSGVTVGVGNSNTMGNGGVGNFGPEISFFEKLIDLHPDTGAYVFKLAQATSALQPTASGQSGIWARSGPSSVQATTTMSFSGSTISAGAGTFDNFEVGEQIQISGSVNNDTGTYGTHLITSIAGDGSSITTASTFTSETNTAGVTVTQGGVPLWSIMHDRLKFAMRKLVEQLGVFPDLQALVFDQAEGDLGVHETYQTALENFIADFRDEFQTRTSGRDVAVILVKLHANTPLGTDTQVAGIRAAQAAVASGDSHVALVDIDDTPLQAEAKQAPGGLGQSYEITTRTNFGVHRTPSACITTGERMGTAWEGLFSNEAPTTTSGGTEGAGGEEGPGGGGGGLLSAFEVETGTASSTSNSYASVAEGDTYFAWIGGDAETVWAAASTEEKEDALRNGTTYIDDAYRSRWKGTIVDEEQALSWPRFGVVTADGFGIDHDVIPPLLKQATLEAAIRYMQGVTLLPDVPAGEGSLFEESLRLGPLALSERHLGTRVAVPLFPKISRKLADFLRRSSRLVRT